MNKRATPILLIAVFLLALAAWRSHVSRSGTQTAGSAASSRLLAMHPQDLIQVRVQRDYWNTFTLARDQDTAWQLTEPAREPASAAAVDVLLQTLTALPILQRIDLPGDDTERHRQYGLWDPRLTVRLLTFDRQEVLLFGDETLDGTGVYCAREGRDGIYIVPASAFALLETNPDHYRASASRTTGR